MQFVCYWKNCIGGGGWTYGSTL